MSSRKLPPCTILAHLFNFEPGCSGGLRPPQTFECDAQRAPLQCGMRKVVKSDKQPFEIKPQTKSVFICMCGLSKNQPFCDGSHKRVTDEQDGKTYEYDSEGHRSEV